MWLLRWLLCGCFVWMLRWLLCVVAKVVAKVVVVCGCIVWLLRWLS